MDLGCGCVGYQWWSVLDFLWYLWSKQRGLRHSQSDSYFFRNVLLVTPLNSFLVLQFFVSLGNSFQSLGAIAENDFFGDLFVVLGCLRFCGWVVTDLRRYLTELSFVACLKP